MRIILATLLVASCASAQDRPDILVADFEQETYGDWAVTGDAFGPGPAQGTLPGQMAVSGFEGERLVNSFLGGDGATGSLTSPDFEIERDYVCFLLGGGADPENTCINLTVDGEVVRAATGPNDRPGGAEALDWATWDVSEFAGQTAHIKIIDTATGGWGHINIDHILQTDTPRALVITSLEIAIDDDYLCFTMPEGADGPRASVALTVDGQVVRTFMQPATPPSEPYDVSLDVSSLRGQTGRLDIAQMPATTQMIADTIKVDDDPRGILIVTDKLYQETYRPQFHFTAQRNWLNDPNGLMYYKGVYHMFFQHNPESTAWGNMTWGHAVSEDLVHWKQLGHAIERDELGTIFSGSGVVDAADTTGFGDGDEAPLVCIYTSAGGTSPESEGQPFTQSIAYSTDGGETFTKYEGNPVLEHIIGANRDPKVIWHEQTSRWIMALYLDGNDYALFGSSDLKEWERLGDVAVAGASECPDFFELPVDGDPNDTRWLFWGANGKYLLGSFDGTTFTAETEVLDSEWGANCYAAQTFSDIPSDDGRRIQIAWMNGGAYPNMPFNQQMSFPRVLTLRTTEDGVRLFREPIAEISLLHAESTTLEDVAIAPGEDPLDGYEGELLHIKADIEIRDASAVGFEIRGERVVFSVADGALSCLGRTAPLSPIDGHVRLEILVDRTSIEVFGNDGRVSLSSCFLPDLTNRRVSVFAEGGDAGIAHLKVYALDSAW